LFTLEGQDTEASLAAAKLCSHDGPLVETRYADRVESDVVGALTAASGRYRIGETRFAGLPPLVDFKARYEPAAMLTNVAGALKGGRVVLNGVLVGTDADGKFTARLDPSELSADVALDRVLLAQIAKDPNIAPVVAAGTAKLAAEKVAFQFDASTPKGTLVGKGSGAHDVRTGKGNATFTSQTLQFAPGKLQPAQLMPGLVGVVGATKGSSRGDAKFTWSRGPGTLKSSADLSLDDLTFRGPGVAVSQTNHLSGRIALSSLTPLTTAGEQTIRIGLVDMDALQLADGVVTYALPGDQTLRISSAEFPWFGGTIGAYDATVPLSPGATEVALRAAGADLKQLLEWVKVDGLSGEGLIEGSLPIVIEGGKAKIAGGSLSAVGPGRLRYTGKAADAASANNENAKLAFDVLRDLKFDRLTALVDGPLDGNLQFKILFEGTSDLTLKQGQVTSPVIYRITLEAPILNLIQSARLSTDFKLQLEQGANDEN
jgi:hypothetical protein